MKANELMIGDWVHVEAHRGFNAQNVKVESIPDPDDDNEYGHHYGHIGAWLESDDNDFRDVEAKHLQPITLTPEILEKNGFERKLDNDGNYNRFTLTYEHASFSLFYARSVFQWYCPLDFKYVHELQHALRLCGIEKEIEL